MKKQKLIIPAPVLPTIEDRQRTADKHFASFGFTFIDQWPQALQDLSFPFIKFELTETDIKALTSPYDDKGFGPDLYDLAQRLDSILQWQPQFIRLNTRSPKDASYPALPITCSGKQAVWWLICSLRTAEDLILYDTRPEILCLILRPVINIFKQWEIRCFVKNGKLLAATQYHKDTINLAWKTLEGRHTTWNSLQMFFDYQIKLALPAQDTFVFDVFLCDNYWKLIEINPYGLSDPILFSYPEIEGQGGFRTVDILKD